MQTSKPLAQALFFPFSAKGKWRLIPYTLALVSVGNLVCVFSEKPALLSLFTVLSEIIFALEYGLRLLLIPLACPNLGACKARFRYAISFLGIIDLLAVISPLLIFTQLAKAEAARLIALVRFVKIGRYTRGLRTIALVFKERKDEILAAFVLLGILTICASVAMFEVEHVEQPTVFTSPFSGLYWAMTTITTTGYGDMVPITAAGKVIGFCTMVLSIGVVAVPAGIFSAGFVDTFKKYKEIRARHKSDNDTTR